MREDYLNMNEKDFDIHRYSGDIELFNSLPDRAKEMILINLGLWDSAKFKGWRILLEQKAMGSPIETIFLLAFETIKPDMNDEYMPSLYLNPQEEIVVDNKKYIADFVFDSNAQFFDVYENKNKKLVIECDGHEFHEKTKEQVKRDNERQYNLKMAGYDVLRFSGSEIFNTPYACAKKTLNYIRKMLKENKDD